MKPLSERMSITATKKRIHPPAIWTILGDYANEVFRLEEENRALKRLVAMMPCPWCNGRGEHSDDCPLTADEK